MIINVTLQNNIRIENPPSDVAHRLIEKYTVANPDFYKLERLGKWTGNTPETLAMWQRDGDTLILPYGVMFDVLHELGAHGCTISSETSHGDMPHDFRSHISLYPYQENAVQAITRAHRGILVAPCGSGKTQMGLEVAARMGVKTLWLTHTHDLLNQSLERAKQNFDLPPKAFGTITAGKVEIGEVITFATVQTMAKLDLTQYRDVWGCVIVDECFPGNAKILTIDGEKELQNLKSGDIIASFNVDSGRLEYKPVVRTFKNIAHDIVRVKMSNGKEIVCTSNHPFFTKRGWVAAGDLNETDYVLRNLRQKDKLGRTVEVKLLQGCKQRLRILFRKMLKGWSGKEQHLDGRTKKKVLRCYGKYESQIRKRTNEEEQPYEASGSERKRFKTIARNRSSSQNSMRKWSWANSATAKFNACISGVCKRLFRISNSNKNAERKRLSDLLQGRHSNTGLYDCDRSGRSFASSVKEARAGQEKGRFFEWGRVESVSVPKQTGDGTFGGLCSDGYVYNIEVADNNNYFVDGVLVHNCHHVAGTPTRLMQFGKVVGSLNAAYKFGLTATPKRSDGLITCMYAYLGPKVYEVDKSEVVDKTCPVKYIQIDTGWDCDPETVTNSDGTLNYTGLISSVCGDAERNNQIAHVISDVANLPNSRILVLSERVQHAYQLIHTLENIRFEQAKISTEIVTGQTRKSIRENAFKRLKSGECKIIFATYQLAKEGLDVPELTHLIMASPNKTEVVVTQSVGRVARKSPGKKFGIVVDFVDKFPPLLSWAKKRERIYKKLGYEPH